MSNYQKGNGGETSRRMRAAIGAFVFCKAASKNGGLRRSDLIAFVRITLYNTVGSLMNDTHEQTSKALLTLSY